MSIIDNAQAKVSEGLSPLTTRVEAMLDGLSPRDRKLFTGLVAFGLIVVVGGSLFLMRSTLDSQQRVLAERRADMQFMQLQQAEFEAAQTTVTEIEAELAQHQSTDFSAFVEKAATSTQVKDQLRSIKKDGPVTTIGPLQQQGHRVDISRAELEPLMNFLYELEGTGYPLRITNAKLTSVRVGGEKRLNAQLDVAVFRLTEEEEG